MESSRHVEWYWRSHLLDRFERSCARCTTKPTDTHVFVGYPIPWSPVTTDAVSTPSRMRADLLIWVALAAAGLGLAAWAVASGARLGTASAPFLGRYRYQIGPLSLLAPAVATGVLATSMRGWFDRHRWGATVLASYLCGLAWALALALVDGAAGLTRPLLGSANYAPDVAAVDDHPVHYIATYTHNLASQSLAARGHPPGPVMLLWALDRLGVRDQLLLAIVVTALGVLTIPLVLYTVRDVCGDATARRYMPVLILAPYAIWVAVSMDAVVATLGAAMVAAGVAASARQRRGLPAAVWSIVCGILLGIAAMFSYAVVWLGLAVVLLYFARRRPFLNLGTGFGALLPVLLANHWGFGWLDGLIAANSDFAARIEPYRSAPWWCVLSIVALLLATGPVLYPSARKIRNTPAWPFLVGAAVAVLFSVLAGLARGGVEAAWLPFFPWLTVAAVAPDRPGGPAPPVPWLLVAAGAAIAMIIEAVLATPW